MLRTALLAICALSSQFAEADDVGKYRTVTAVGDSITFGSCSRCVGAWVRGRVGAWVRGCALHSSLPPFPPLLHALTHTHVSAPGSYPCGTGDKAYAAVLQVCSRWGEWIPTVLKSSHY